MTWISSSNIFMLLLFVYFSCNNYQNEKSEGKMSEKHKILNSVVCSVPFSELTIMDNIIFLSNELLTSNHKFLDSKIIVTDSIPENLQYAVLGDITFDTIDPLYARVQIEIFPQNLLFNARVALIERNWNIESCSILEN